MRTNLFFIIVLLSIGSLFSQNKEIKGPPITTNNTNYTPQQLVEDVLITGCLQASNITFTGGATARGYFDANGSNFPFSNGVILASGNISTACGPNGSGSDGTNLGKSGDTDLSDIINDDTYDAAILEFDFVPSSDTIKFRYIFASEEYNEYVCANVNDVFGFFLSGPGINGPFTNNAKNIALIPNSTVPVSINSVNNGSIGSSGSSANCISLAYSNYFFDNTTGTGQAIEYDGRTVILTAMAVVQPCQTYHIKLAIADGGDGIYDSGVFLEAGSFSSGGQVAMTNYSAVGDNSSLYEGCTNYYVFSRLDSTDLTDSVEVLLTYSGTAIQGTDISYFPTSFWIPSGQIYDTIYYNAYNDGLLEGTETIILTLLSGCPCNSSVVTDTIFIYDVEEIKGGIQDMTNAYCSTSAPDSIMIFASVTIDPNATYTWSTGETGNTIYVDPLPGRNWYWVTITDPCGNLIYDSIPIIIGNFSGIDVQPQAPLCHNTCNGSITVTPNNGAPPYTYTWIPNGTANDGNATGLCSGYYKVTVTDSLGCKYFTPTALYLSDPAPLSNLQITNTTTQYCNNTGQNITINTSFTNDSVLYIWNTAETGSSITTTPPIGLSTYWVQFKDICNNSITDSIQFRRSDMSGISKNITNILCHNTCTGSATLSAIGGSAPYTYTWYPPSIGSSSSGTISSLCANSYFVTITDIAGCTKKDTIIVTMPDELVPTTIVHAHDSANLCIGSASITALGGTPPYNFLWSNIASSTSADVNNLCAGPYTITITDSNGCTKTKSIVINNLTSIDIIDLNNKISIYPNPSYNGSINIDIDKSLIANQVEIYDYTGKKLIHSQTINLQNIKVENLSSGMYFIKISFDDFFVTEKFIIAD